MATNSDQSKAFNDVFNTVKEAPETNDKGSNASEDKPHGKQSQVSRSTKKVLKTSRKAKDNLEFVLGTLKTLKQGNLSVENEKLKDGQKTVKEVMDAIEQALDTNEEILNAIEQALHANEECNQG
ncbi:hypothetical protein PtrSN002B_010195 [Pyrenophora tritici-repentis]|uniref:Uncharacterized protein n=2 Tax=Pyrenophora tritici-repentis TaxID=45151 RepID=A0A2W1HFY7_9PLEO|nr:uncharacterized protein PTRG_05177 [Pyrenophora tritici-repentis Pt-1C-BFP]KAF7447440.1 hypothetical protein A1F99_088870 [Pyrenophora tritici-repentis]EDU48084.1 predicted protein [Pyrenophora tritici-repentis Pt-1C-BFP]KAF7569808.1 hypothetical protein PtrM4_122230 [Pyrenophora tritici-repentis]KAG9382471.1 hypothetical protein A1F94_006392 [Pyrenophora tritici-repentis]KAI0572596.1 hypothetical protein Alg215_09696 [Pyrenophora tritici-repentis]